jgi:hypothetical protein
VSGDSNGDSDIFVRESNSDADSILDPFDNCPTVNNNPAGDDPPNDVQADVDGDGTGDACDTVAAPIATSTNLNTPVTITLSATDHNTCELAFTTAGVVNGTLGPVNNSPCTAGTPNTDTATVTFTPTTGICTPQAGSFSYTATDGVTSGSANVTVTINCLPGPNVTTGNTSTNEDTPKVITLSATDADNCELGFTTFGSINGTLGSITTSPCTPGSPNSDTATVTFTPTANRCNPQNGSFNNTANDGVQSDTKVVSITITCTPDTPVGLNINVTTDEDDSVAVTLTATDPDATDCELTFTPGAASNGTLGALNDLPCTPGSPNNDSAVVTFTPNQDTCSPTGGSFSYTASDGTLTSASRTVTITVNCINDPPLANSDSKSTFEDEALVFPASDLTANDTAGATNETGQILNVSSVTATGDTHGIVGLASGAVTYTPDPGYVGAASFDYEVCDDGMSGNPPSPDPQCATGTVNIRVGLIVTSTGDGGHAGGVQVCNDGSGQCTLRAAIQQANAHAGEDKIHFNILPAGTHTISPASALPTISGALTIDGTTQPGFSSCTAAARVIELNGTAAGATTNGLEITGGDSLIRGLAINRFGGHGIRIQTGGNNDMECNYIGTGPNGTTSLPNGASGVYILDSADNRIGGDTAGAQNTIANNAEDGIRVDGVTAVGNMISQNSIHSNALLGIEHLNGGNGDPIPPAISEAGSDAVPGAAGYVVVCLDDCLIEIFSDDAEEGRIYRGSTETSGGNWSWPGPIPVGPNITATLTDPSTDSTSRFSAPYPCPDADADLRCDGDECDNDNDRICDVEDDECGANRNNASRRPERIDGIFAEVDDDGDMLIDEPLPAGKDIYDCDGDGYIGRREEGKPLCANTANDDDRMYVAGSLTSDDSLVNDGCPAVGPAESACGTSMDDDGDGWPNDGCPQAGSLTEGSFNISTSDQDPCGTNGWPADFVSGQIPDSTNRITISDLISFVAPVRRLDTSPGHNDFSQRWDLVPGRGFFNNWVAIDDLTTLIVIKPQMIGNLRAFSGPVCPWAP